MRKRCDGDMGRKLREACRRVRNAILGGSILICAAMALTGCHGARGSAAFEIPAEFVSEYHCKSALIYGLW